MFMVIFLETIGVKGYFFVKYPVWYIFITKFVLRIECIAKECASKYIKFMKHIFLQKIVSRLFFEITGWMLRHCIRLYFQSDPITSLFSLFNKSSEITTQVKIMRFSHLNRNKIKWKQQLRKEHHNSTCKPSSRRNSSGAFDELEE